MILRISWAAQQLVPPALLTYFFWAWRTITFDIAPNYIVKTYKGSLLVRIYTVLPTILIAPISLSFLTLYFLPRNKSVAPPNPPDLILSKRVIFECLSPNEAKIIRLAISKLQNPPSATSTLVEINDDDEDYSLQGGDEEPVVNRCWKGRCGGRWKPARARHCSECGVCRAGFDHHCVFFANCLTSPSIPVFLHLLLTTPPTVIVLSMPLYLPLIKRARLAWRLACLDGSIKKGWWDWWASWIVAGGPVGRWGGGLILGWRALDRSALGEKGFRLEIGVLAFLGVILGLITTGLAVTSISLILKGDLTIDRERHRSHSRALRAKKLLMSQGQMIPENLKRDLERYNEKRYFWIPVDSSSEQGEAASDEMSDGVIVETLEGEQPYDHGAQNNWELIMGKGWSWLFPWQAINRGMSYEQIINWPIAPAVSERMRQEAVKRVKAREELI